MIVVVFGLPGSGKSYFAEKLAKEMKAIYISSDIVRKNEFEESDYSLKSKRIVYRRMIEMGGQAVNQKRNVVFDGTFYRESIRKMMAKNFNSNSMIHFIEVLASEELIRTRTVNKRIHSDADFEVYRKIKGNFQQLKLAHLQLESSNDNVKEMIQKAMTYLNLNPSES